jgi:DNA polymerase III epsilon subunit-like protein
VSLIFIDFEASSLSSRSYPIEIGCAWIEDDRVVHVAELIRPDPSWPPDWSAESAAVHGIGHAALALAEPAVSVARRFATLLTGRTIVSDAPDFDSRWLGRLLELTPQRPSFRVIDFDGLLHVAMSHEAQRAAFANLACAPTPHRAGGDAARLATAWLAGMRAESGR